MEIYPTFLCLFVLDAFVAATENYRCIGNEFLCDENLCINNFWVCDGDQDCTDGSDEDYNLCRSHLTAAEVKSPVLNVTGDDIDVPVNTSLYLSCTGYSLLQWQFQDPVSKSNSFLTSLSKRVSGPSGSELFESIIRLDLNTYKDTGRYSCFYSGAKTKSASLYIFVNDNRSLLLPIEENTETVLVHEDQEFVIPCLTTNSIASVNVSEGTCDDTKSVPLEDLTYNRTIGFVIARGVENLQGFFCCRARLGEHVEDTAMFYLLFIAKTNFAPVVHVTTDRNECVEVNSSFTLTCIIEADLDAMLHTEWSYPVKDASRLLLPGHKRIADQNNFMHEKYEDKLTVKNALEIDKGYYKCTATDHSHRMTYSEVYVNVCGHLTAAEVSPVLNVTGDHIDVPVNTSLYLSCTGSSLLQWKFQDPVSKSNSILSSLNERVLGPSGSELFESIIRLDLNTYEDTGRYSCFYNGTKAKSASLYIFVNDNRSLLIPVQENIVLVHEDQEFVIPCLMTNSNASVYISEGTCDDAENVPLENLTYNRTVGFVIARGEDYFEGNFCCGARLYEHVEDKAMIYLHYIAKTNFAPVVSVQTDRTECVEVNSSLNLTCIIVVEAEARLHTEWSYPVKDAKRLHISGHKMTANRNMSMHQEYVDKLTVENTQEMDKGYYRCTVTDYLNRTNYSEVYVNVCDNQILLLRVKQNTVLVHEDQEFVIPCLTTNSNASVYISKGRCDDTESVPLEDLTYNRTVGFVIAPGVDYLEDVVCCRARLGEHVEAALFDLYYVGNLTAAEGTSPVLNVIGDNIDVPVNTSLYLSCTGNFLLQWQFQDPVSKSNSILSSFNKRVPGPSGSELFASIIWLDLNTYEDTGRYSCFYNGTKAKSASLYIFVNDYEQLLLQGKKYFIEVPVHEGQNFTIPCLATISNATVTLWKGKCGEESSLINNLPYDPTVGFLITNARRFFQGDFCCKAQMNEFFQAQAMFKLNYIKKTNFAPVVRVQTHRTGCVEVNSSFTLTCIIVVEAETVLHSEWSYPSKDASRLSLSGLIRSGYQNNRMHDKYEDNLTVKNALEIDKGYYKCTATDHSGRTNYSEVYVNFCDSLDTDTHQIVILTILSVGALSSLIMLLFAARRAHKRKQVQKKMKLLSHALYREGQVSLFDINIPLDEQVELLPYDEKWEFPVESLKFGRILGQGAFARIVEAEASGINDYEKSTTVAVKMLKEEADIKQQKALMAELKTLTHLGFHVNIVNLLGAVTKYIPQGELMMMVEYCRFGNLRHYLLRSREKFVPEDNPSFEKIKCAKQHLPITTMSASYSTDADTSHHVSLSSSGMPQVSTVSSVENRSHELFRTSETGSTSTTRSSTDDGSQIHFSADNEKNCITTADLICFAFQCARGMEYLASIKMIHRDLEARNILLADDNIVKISDFSLAKDCCKSSNYVRKGDGPLPVKWLAVESLTDNIFTTKSDVWSFGVLLWEFFTLGGDPYPDVQIDEDFYRKLKQGYRMWKPDFAPDIIYKIMKNCWRLDPVDRPDFTQLVDALGELLEPEVRQHYIDMNEPYVKMNQQSLDHSYLNVTSKENPGSADYVNSSVSANIDDYDKVPPVKYTSEEKSLKSAMEVVPVIHFEVDENNFKPRADASDRESCTTSYLNMKQRQSNGSADGVERTWL